MDCIVVHDKGKRAKSHDELNKSKMTPEKIRQSNSSSVIHSRSHALTPELTRKNPCQVHQAKKKCGCDPNKGNLIVNVQRKNRFFLDIESIFLFSLLLFIPTPSFLTTKTWIDRSMMNYTETASSKSFSKNRTKHLIKILHQAVSVFLP